MKTFMALLLMSAATFATADLGPGDAAPPLSVKTWIKGEPVASLAKDKTYVVEFWATWCGPCIQSIPHLTEVAHKNPDVTFIGVSVWEDDVDGSIKKFVDGQGDKMDYHVGYSGNQDGMAQSWMKQAAQNGIPAAFIVKEGKIQWVGHPMEIEDPLKQVKAGTFDVAKFRASFDKQAIETRKQMALNQAVTDIVAMYDAGNRQAAKDKLTALVAKDPSAKGEAETLRFQWLAREDLASWELAAKKLIASGKPGDLQQVRNLALYECTAPKGDSKISRKAIELIMTAVPKPDNLTFQYAIAVYERLHDYSKATECVDKLLAALPDNAENADLRAAMTKKKADLETKAKQQH